MGKWELVYIMVVIAWLSIIFYLLYFAIDGLMSISP